MSNKKHKMNLYSNLILIFDDSNLQSMDFCDSISSIYSVFIDIAINYYKKPSNKLMITGN